VDKVKTLLTIGLVLT